MVQIVLVLSGQKQVFNRFDLQKPLFLVVLVAQALSNLTQALLCEVFEVLVNERLGVNGEKLAHVLGVSGQTIRAFLENEATF